MNRNMPAFIDATLDALFPAVVLGILGAPGWVAGGWFATLFVVFSRQNRGPQK